MSKHDDEIRDAELLRALDSVVDSWENDDLDIDDMTDHLEAVNEIAEGKKTFSQFIKKFNLRKIFDA